MKKRGTSVVAGSQAVRNQTSIHGEDAMYKKRAREESRSEYFGPKLFGYLAVLSILIVTAPQTVLAHRDSGYSHDSDIGYTNPDWMGALPDDTRLSELSLPGTHDTMALYWGDMVQTQSMSLSTQLTSGIRVLDIRAWHVTNQFSMNHGLTYQFAGFENDVMAPTIAFLQSNPSETVLMRVKEEFTPAGNLRSFGATFASYMQEYGVHVWQPTCQNPDLGEVRGKIVILQDFDDDDHGDWGILYNSLDQQDDYSLGTNWDLYDKWKSVEDHLNNARYDNENTISINYLSGSGGSFPYFVASGHSSHGTSAARLWTGLTTLTDPNTYPDFPRKSCFLGLCSIYFEGTNILARKHIDRHAKFSGIVMADFPGAGLIDAIIRLNQAPYTQFTSALETPEESSVCMDLEGGNTSNGTKIQVYRCNGTDAQQWVMDSDGYIHSRLDYGKCFDPRGPSTDSGTRIQIYGCRDDFIWQQWIVNSDASVSPKNDPTKCIDVSGGHTHNGNKIQLWDCNGTEAQLWATEIRSGLGSNTCLDLEHTNTNNGTKIQLYQCKGTDAQQWHLDDDGYIRNKQNPEKCFDPKGPSTATGTQIQIYDCRDNFVWQQWIVNSDGSVSPKNDPGMCLDVSGGHTHNGNKIQLWPCNGTPSQQWGLYGRYGQ